MHLRTFGGLSIDAAGDASVRSIGPRQLALLAIVAAAGARGITREKILGILWPESDEELARHTLSQTLYRLRRETGAAWITGTAQLRLDASLDSDVADFQQALSADQLDRAAALYAGPFLDGFYLSGAPEFERWVEETRAQLQTAAQKALETLVRRAVDGGVVAEATGWWRRLVELDPFNAKYAAGQIRALIDSGDPGSALRVAQEHESRVRRELEVEPDPVIVELIAQLRSMPATIPPSPVPTVIAAAPVPPPKAADSAIGEVSIPVARRPGSRLWVSGVLVATLATVVLIWRIGGIGASSAEAPPLLAIGTIQSRDTAALGPVLRDMLATNLARVRGLEVLSNSRLLELLPRESPTERAATTDAARRAGASEIVEGELGVSTTGLVLTLRRIALRSGLVLEGYSVHAPDLYALTDSATAAIAQDFRLDPPPDAVATVRTRSAVAYALYEQGLRAFYQGDVAPANRLMKAALDRDSTFAMAAFFAWLSDRVAGHMDEAGRALPALQRLATRTVDRERLWIEGTIAQLEAPADEFLDIAQEMTRRFPDDPDGQILLGQALWAVGDWAGSVAAFDRAIAIDSTAGATGGPYCRVCAAANGMSISYLWWDSVAAAERTAQRLLAFRPAEGSGWAAMVEPLLRQGRRAEAEAAIARAEKLSAVRLDYAPTLDRDLIRWGRYDELEARLVSELRGSSAGFAWRKDVAAGLQPAQPEPAARGRASGGRWDPAADFVPVAGPSRGPGHAGGRRARTRPVS